MVGFQHLSSSSRTLGQLTLNFLSCEAKGPPVVLFANLIGVDNISNKMIDFSTTPETITGYEIKPTWTFPSGSEHCHVTDFALECTDPAGSINGSKCSVF